MTNEFLGVSLFMDVQDQRIKAWNVWKTAKNMGERHGPVLTKQYLLKQDKATLIRVRMLGELVNRKGEEYVRRQISRAS